jgi:signal transduction histidine kinase
VTVTRRILLQLAMAAGLVICVTTAVTYVLVLQAAKERDLQHLETYVTERARSEEIGFKQVEANLTLVRGQFLKRIESHPPEDYETRWNERFRLFEDGSWRSREEFADGRRYSTLWAHKDVQLTPEWQIQILHAQDMCDELMPGWVDAFPSLYFNFPGPANIGFDPRIPSWVWDTPADYDMDAQEWVYIGKPTHNPSRDFAWTGVLEEEVSKSPQVGALLPIDRNGEMLCSVAHSINVRRLMEEATQSTLAGSSHIIFRRDGRLISHPPKSSEIIASKGQLTALACGDPAVASVYRAAVSRNERQFGGYDPGSDSYYRVARLAGPEWLFVTLLPRAQLQRQAFASAQWVLWSGLFVLALMLGLLAVILRRQIAQPLAELSRVTGLMSAGDIDARAAVRRTDELGILADSFNQMAERVGMRDAELRQLNHDLEQRVTARTAELTEAIRQLDHSREEALRLLARERELGDLKSNFVSLVSHEFRTPLGVILSAADVLARYFERLPAEKRARHLEMITRSTKNLAHLVDEVLVLGKVEEGRMRFAPEPLDLATVCRQLSDEIRSATDGVCPIQFTARTPLDGAISDESLLRHILSNLLSNAVKYSEPDSPVEFSAGRQGDDVLLVVRDHGIGIPKEDREQLFTTFTRGGNVGPRPGTGLGLVIVQRCVELHGGDLQLESEPGQGTTITVRLPVFGARKHEFSTPITSDFFEGPSI